MSKTFRVMKGQEVELAKLRYPLIAQPKLDGIRCYIRGGVAYSASNKPIRNQSVQDWAQCSDDTEELDGELLVGDHDAEVYNRTNSVVMSTDGPDTWTFWVFDLIPMSVKAAPYRARLKAAVDRVKELDHRARAVPSRTVRNEGELQAFYEECLKRGYEGVMVRDPQGPYKWGKSTVKEGWLLKWKPFTDAEATVVGWGERMHNTNEAKVSELGRTKRSQKAEGMVPAGDLGYLKVRDGEGRHFNIGTGFTAAQRVSLWAEKDQLLNRILKFKYQECGTKDSPRLPVFVGWRHEDDM